MVAPFWNIRVSSCDAAFTQAMRPGVAVRASVNQEGGPFECAASGDSDCPNNQFGFVRVSVAWHGLVKCRRVQQQGWRRGGCSVPDAMRLGACSASFLAAAAAVQTFTPRSNTWWAPGSAAFCWGFW